MEYVFLDVETHHRIPFKELSKEKQTLFADYVFDGNDADPIDVQWAKKAGLKPELGCIICVSATVIKKWGVDLKNFSDFQFANKSFAIGHDGCKDEKDVLLALSGFLDAAKGYGIAGYNSKSFDIPFIIKRWLANGLDPKQLSKLLTRDLDDKWGKSQNTIDVMDMYKMGGRAEKLVLATSLFGISSKTEKEYDGKYLHEHSFEDILKNMESRIIPYCEEDVVTTAKLWICLRNFRAIHGLV